VRHPMTRKTRHRGLTRAASAPPRSGLVQLIGSLTYHAGGAVPQLAENHAPWPHLHRVNIEEVILSRSAMQFQFPSARVPARLTNNYGVQMKDENPLRINRARTPTLPVPSTFGQVAELVLARELGMLIGKHLAATHAAAEEAGDDAGTNALRDR